MSAVGPAVRCAPAAEARSDALAGTAAPASRFVLVEQPGAWGRSALTGSGLRPDVARALVDRCREADARLLLVRRRHKAAVGSRLVAVVDARPGHERTWRGSFGDDEELLDLDPHTPAGTASPETIFLVCTHGRRDPCCARRGWLVARALTEAYPDRVWQCSHVGGDRFAANLVVLPHGLYYGWVSPADGLEIARAQMAGAVVPRRLRGRSVFSPPVQVAQHHARSALGSVAIDALPPLAVEERGSLVQVTLADPAGSVVVTLERVESEPISRVTCGTTIPARVVEHQLLSLEV